MKAHNLPDYRESFWHKTGEIEAFKALKEDENVDVAVIGGGMAGILAAYELAQTEKTVSLYEARELVHGTTGYTTSKLSAQHNLIYSELIDRYGVNQAKAYYHFNMEGIERVKDIAEKHEIDCGLRKKDAYVYSNLKENLPLLKKEAEAYDKLSINGEFVDQLNIDLPIEGALVMHDQYEFHPVQFLSGLIQVLKSMGVNIYEDTIITEVEQGETVKLTTSEGYTVTCGKAICASHYPVYDPGKYYAKNMDPEMSLATAYELDEKFQGDMYISFDRPRRTFRGMSTGDKEYILVGGESHTLGDGSSDEERYKNITNFARTVFGVDEVYAHWSSHDHMTGDRMPFIGKGDPESENIFVATGFSKWGLANAAEAAVLICDMIEGRENVYENLLDPNREIPDTEEADKKDDKTSYDQSVKSENVKDLKNGQAMTLKIDDKDVGVYKDENGKLHYLDIACTHLGCDLGWNDGDKSWDCPCHGSRFNATGDVIAGPANKPLKKVDMK